ncbi:helix-turn-helix domain-containing protein, partial [Dysosmobacter sp.]
MDARGITRNRLRTLTGVKYDVIDRYYKGQDIALVDLDFLAKVCYVLDCKVEDLLQYEGPDQ